MFSAYRSTYPKQPSFRPDFPRPPDQLPPNEDYQIPISTYKNEYADIPNDYQRPLPIPNQNSWEPESDPNARSQPMISLFHSSFISFSLSTEINVRLLKKRPFDYCTIVGRQLGL